MPTRRALCVAAVAVVGILSGCAGSDSSDNSAVTNITPTTAEPSPPRTTTPVDSAAATDPATSSTSSSTTTSTTTAATTTSVASSTSTAATPPTTSATGETIEVSTRFPSGSFVAVAPGDAVVLSTDGDLELRPRLIGTVDDPAIPLVDNPDPRKPVEEGPGPNVIDAVAGFANGSLIYGDCCEPVSGNVYALTDPGADPVTISGGYDPVLSPDGQRLATANTLLISVTPVDGSTGMGLLLNQSVDDPSFGVVGVQWTSNDEIAVISRNLDDELTLTTFDATSLAETTSVSIGTAAAGDFSSAAAFAGFGEDGTVAVAIRGDDETTIRFFEPGSLTETAETRTLPSTVSSVEFVPGGLGLIWVDGEVLYHLAPGQLEARPLATDVLAAWALDPGIV